MSSAVRGASPAPTGTGTCKAARASGTSFCPLRWLRSHLEASGIVYGRPSDRSRPIFATLRPDGSREQPETVISQREFNYNLRSLLRRAGVPEAELPSARGVRAARATEVDSATADHAAVLAVGAGKSAKIPRRHYVRRGEAYGFLRSAPLARRPGEAQALSAPPPLSILQGSGPQHR
jgi:hypothetical protein